MGVSNDEKLRQKKSRIGEIKYNRYGTKMQIINYNCESDIIVKFNDTEYIVKTTYREFKNNQLNSPYDKTICNIGFLGEGNYGAFDVISNVPTKEYDAWRSMIRRCYKKNINNNSYKNCTVCEEWHNFQNFAKWYDENYYEVDNEKMCVDKDILHKGNKVYSPENCIIVPNCINCIFIKHKETRSNLPIGVYSRVNRQPLRPYVAQCSDVRNGTQKTLGSFSTPIEAFHVYKEYKEKYIKEIANMYIDIIPKKLYDAMYKYEVELTD